MWYADSDFGHGIEGRIMGRRTNQTNIPSGQGNSVIKLRGGPANGRVVVYPQPIPKVLVIAEVDKGLMTETHCKVRYYDYKRASTSRNITDYDFIDPRGSANQLELPLLWGDNDSGNATSSD